MKTLRGVFALLLIGAATLAHAADVSESAKYGLSVTTPVAGRWTHTVKEDADSFMVRLRDSRDQANGFVYAVLAAIYSGSEYASPRDLAEKRLIPRYVASHGASHTVVKSAERKVVLGNGTEATLVNQRLLIQGNRNTHDRSMAFVFWKGQVEQKEIWYFGALANAENYFDLESSELIPQILAGIK